MSMQKAAAGPAGPSIDGLRPQAYPDTLYQHQAVATPLPSLADLDEAQVGRYHEQGFVAVRALLGPAEVESAMAGLSDLIMGRSPGTADLQFESWARDRLAELPLEAREPLVRKLMWFCDAEPRLGALARDARLLAVVRRLLGGREPKLFQDMALLKPPGGREKPWHQDHAYFNLPRGTPVVGIWIALDPATVENGCLRFRPGTHRLGPAPHFDRRDWQICDTHYREEPVVAVPLPPGGAVFFDGLVQHGTPTNPSTARRRALQFHYAPADVAVTSTQERMAIFGSEGRNVTC